MFDLPGPPIQFMSKKERAEFMAQMDAQEKSQPGQARPLDWDRVLAIGFFIFLLFANAGGCGGG